MYTKGNGDMSLLGFLLLIGVQRGLSLVLKVKLFCRHFRGIYVDVLEFDGLLTDSAFKLFIGDFCASDNYAESFHLPSSLNA